MPALNNGYSSLLVNLSKDQVNDLIIEEKLKSHGFIFHYIVDNYDLGHYAYPLGLTKVEDKNTFRQNLTFTDKLDEHITFDILFNDKSKYFFLLDEHLSEYYDFQLTVKNHVAYNIEIVDTHKELLSAFSENENAYKRIDILEKIETFKLSLIISLAIGYLRNGILKLEKVMKDERRLITDREGNITNNDIKYLVDIISSTRPSTLTDEIFKHAQNMAESIPGSSISKQNKRNKIRNDCDVVDRVISINNNLQRDSRSKLLCLYLSSTQTSLNWFHQSKTNNRLEVNLTMETINEIIKQNLLILKLSGNEELINPHRTSAQLFLSLIMDEEDIDQKIENLNKFKDSLNEDHHNPNSLSNETNKFLKDRIIRFREKSENYAMLLQFDKFQNTLKEAKELRSVKRYKELIRAFELILQQGREIDQIKKLKDQNFRLYYYEKSFKRLLNDGYSKLNQIVEDFSYSGASLISLITMGNDPVAGKYHILPIVFFIKDEKITPIINQYTKFIVSETVTEEERRNIVTNFYSTLKDIMNEIKREEGNGILQKLMSCLLLLLLPKEVKNEKLILQRIKEILDYEIKPEEEIIKLEFYYIGAWVARRTKDFNAASGFTTLGEKMNPHDPRFAHSRALIHYCKSFSETSEQKIESLQNTISFCEKSISLYTKIEKPSNEIVKSISALINTIIYSQCLIYDCSIENNTQSKYEELLKDARVRLNNELKTRENNYNSYFEFLHTEAFLELMESHSFITKKDYVMAKSKICFAIQATDKALNLNPIDEDCISLHKRIVDYSSIIN